MVELALIAPVFLLLLLTAIDLGRLLYSQITITNAAKEGALVASQGGTYQGNQPCSDTNEVMCGVLSEAKGGFVQLDQTKVTLSPATCVKDAMYPKSGAPPNVSIAVQAPFRVITPIIGAFIGSNLTLNAVADAQCLVVPRVTFPSIPSPTATFTMTPSAGAAPVDVMFDGSGSSSPGATITSYAWNFGGSGPIITNSYTTAGTYTIVLTVTDSRGKTDTESKTLTITGGPPPVCPVIAFAATDRSNKSFPHRMNLDATLTPSIGSWAFSWTGAITASGQSPNNVDFPKSGPQSVTVTATDAPATCSVTLTQDVTAP